VELVIRELGKLHAAWWGDARLDQTPWLPMKGIKTPDQAPVVLSQNWESFLGKLRIPVTKELLAAGEFCARYLYAVSVSMYTEPPRTLIHHDVQGDNLLVAGDGEPSLALIDWQLTTAARPVLDLADFLVAHLDTSERRRHEDRLLEIYSATTFRCMMRICPVLHRNLPGRRRTQAINCTSLERSPDGSTHPTPVACAKASASDQPVGSRSAAGTTDTPTSSATYRRQGSDRNRQSAGSAGGREHDASSFQLGLNPYPFNVALPAGRLLPEVVWDVQHLAGLHQ
jgi:Phosphotransferase enzyme family